MAWNWQQPDWPSFTWRAERIASAERQFLLAAGVGYGAFLHATDEDRGHLVLEVLSDEAMTSSEIEGELLDRASVQSSIQRALGIGPPGDGEGSDGGGGPAERGIAEMMVDLYRRFDAPMSVASLCAWQGMVCRGRRDLREVGRLRSASEPMRIVSGRLDAPEVHFEAPPSERVPPEMDAFVVWFNESAPKGGAPLPALTRAAIAHLYFESIHPFEDGNGRVGRAVAEKALAQSLGRPTLTAIGPTILANRRAYYQALEAASRHNEVTPWLAWFGAIVLEAQQGTIARVRFLVEKSRLLARFGPELNERQRVVLLRMLREGPEGFKGGLSAGKYATIARTSAATATRDLGEMVRLGVLTRSGDRRHTRYFPAIPTHPLPRYRIEADGSVVEVTRDRGVR